MGDTEPKSKPFTRRDMDSFDDPRVEDFCRARVKGSTIRASATYATIAYQTGLEWEKRPEIKARIRELKEGAEAISLVSVAYVMNGLKKNAEQARDNGQFKASNEALKILYDLIKTDKEALGGGLRLGGNSSPAAVRAALREALQKPALPADASPAPSVAELLEAEGETVESE